MFLDVNCLVNSRNSKQSKSLLQEIAHGHETTISIVGLNGIVHESTFNVERTADCLAKMKEALNKQMTGRMYAGTRSR